MLPNEILALTRKCLFDYPWKKNTIAPWKKSSRRQLLRERTVATMSLKSKFGDLTLQRQISGKHFVSACQ